MGNLGEVKKLIDKLKALCPSDLDGGLKNSPSPYPLQAAVIFGCLLHRIVELSEVATMHIENDYRIPAAVVIRAVFESAALAYLLESKISKALTNGDLSSIKNSLERIGMGSRNSDTEISSYNILNAIDEANKEFEGIRGFYDDLSEFSHPNYAGTMCSYSRLSECKTGIVFGRNGGFGMPSEVLLLSLHSALLLVASYAVEWVGKFEAFKLICAGES